MKTGNRFLTAFFVILAAGLFAGCGTGKESPTASADSENTLPAYSTVFGPDIKKESEESVSDVPEGETTEPFDFSSDAAPTQEQLEAAAQEYYLWPSESVSITINSSGKVLHEEDIHVSRLTDVITGETKYYTAYYKTYKKKDEWDYDVAMRSRLYDVSGHLVSDWSDRQYTGCIGDWVMSQKYIDFACADGTEDTDSRMEQLTTGEERQDIISVDRISADAAFVQAKDNEDSFTVDTEGNVLYEFSTLKDSIPEKHSFSVYQQYVVAEVYTDPLYELQFFTQDGKLLGKIGNVENTYVYDSGIMPPYVMCDNVIYDPSNGDGGELSAVFAQGQPSYYDGELAVCATLKGDTIAGYRLYDAKTGGALSGEYTSVAYKASERTDSGWTPSAFFIGVSEDRLEKLDRTGKVVASAGVDHISDVYIYDTGILVNCDEYTGASLLNTELQTVIPVGRYDTIAPVYRYDEAEDGYVDDLWYGMYTLDAEQLQQRTDLFSTDGTVWLKGASSAGAMSHGKIPVVRGFSMGLVDEHGEWIVKIAKNEVTNSD